MVSTKKSALAEKRHSGGGVHPGKVLHDKYMKPNGINTNRLSLELRVPATRVLAIVHGERGISSDTALRLARFFCTTPEYWLDLQSAYELELARAEAGEAIAQDVKDGCAKKRS